LLSSFVYPAAFRLCAKLTLFSLQYYDWLASKDWITGQARDDTVYSLVGSVSGSGGLVSTIQPFHLFTKYLE